MPVHTSDVRSGMLMPRTARPRRRIDELKGTGNAGYAGVIKLSLYAVLQAS